MAGAEEGFLRLAQIGKEVAEEGCDFLCGVEGFCVVTKIVTQVGMVG
jgi:hypothetical protein